MTDAPPKKLSGRPTRVMVRATLRLPSIWYAIVHRETREVVAMFSGSDMASDVLFGENAGRTSYFDDDGFHGHHLYEILEVAMPRSGVA